MFAARTKMHASTLLYNVEGDNTLSANFYANGYVLGLPEHERKPYVHFQFNEKGLSSVRYLKITYSPAQINDCLAKYEYLIKLFKPYTQKLYDAPIYSDPEGKNRIGEGVRIKPITGANFCQVNISYTYNSLGNRYELQILVFEDNLWK